MLKESNVDSGDVKGNIIDDVSLPMSQVVLEQQGDHTSEKYKFDIEDMSDEDDTFAVACANEPVSAEHVPIAEKLRSRNKSVKYAECSQLDDHSAFLSEYEEPSTFEEAVNSKQYVQWKSAMNEEMKVKTVHGS